MIEKMRLDNRIQPLIFLEDPYKLSQIIIPSIFLLGNKGNVTREAFRAKQYQSMRQKKSCRVNIQKRHYLHISLFTNNNQHKKIATSAYTHHNE